jgi:hypothetical protein
VGCFRKLQADVPAVDASAGSPSTIPTKASHRAACRDGVWTQARQ